ncbi:MAG TPA: CocE/NonD family hydrolase [Acidimicrobiia bacterium]|nr:CocE/NonD family hydrolase [Acidimicrobiia bacterium]
MSMRAATNEVKVERDVPVTMPDGVELLTDLFHPVGVDDAPAILERTPYGRAGISGSGYGPVLAERGYRYVLQASRGTDGSGGSHSYFAEVGDGRATADWIAEQSWFNGSLGTYGGSYMGYTQWALASTEPPHLKAMAVALCGSVRRFAWYPGGSYALEIIIPWDMGAVNFNKPQPATTEDSLSPEAIARRMAVLQEGFDHLPLGDAIKHLSGEDLPLYREQLAHNEPDDPYWSTLDFSPMLATWKVPILLVDGWQDYQCPRMLDDYVALRAGGTPVWVRIGAGGHIGGGGEGGMTEAPLLWFDTYLKGMTGLLPERTVTLEVLGEGGGWRDFEAWPPPASPTPWFLHPSGRLSTEMPAGAAEPVRYRYDPGDPTPSVGGIGMLTGGQRDNRELEARRDVCVFTSDALERALEVIGPVQVDLHVSSSLDHTDFFARVCDVAPDGRSTNVCDGLQRFTPATIERATDGSFHAKFSLWPTAYRFAPGHRVRVQVSSGAHPVYARNLGTGESPFTATTWKAADQAVYHDSSVTLPHAS